MAERAVATINHSELAASYGFSRREVEMIHEHIAPDATLDELKLFLYEAKSRGLNPFTGEIWAVTRYDRDKKRYVTAHQTGIKGHRLNAMRSGEYEGQVGPWFCGLDAVWKDIWLSDEPPAAAKVGVYRTGFREPVFGIATWATFAQKKRDGELMPFWKSMPDVMLAKCAERIALEKAFAESSSVGSIPQQTQLRVVPTAVVDGETGEILEQTGPQAIGASANAGEFDRNQINRALHQWMESVGGNHEDLHNASVYFYQGRTLRELTPIELDQLRGKLESMQNTDSNAFTSLLMDLRMSEFEAIDQEAHQWFESLGLDHDDLTNAMQQIVWRSKKDKTRYESLAELEAEAEKYRNFNKQLVESHEKDAAKFVAWVKSLRPEPEDEPVAADPESDSDNPEEMGTEKQRSTYLTRIKSQAKRFDWSESVRNFWIHKMFSKDLEGLNLVELEQASMRLATMSDEEREDTFVEWGNRVIETES